ncbi:MAG TPA: MgtC/SapB family protein [Terriglobia bacterium]|jgi:uncharacterized membrane protein (DUF4010 family)
MNPETEALVGMLIATLGGLAVGLERQWSGHATGPQARFAGVRTFTLLGMLAGMAGWMWTQQAQLLAALLIAGAVALVVAAYVAASRRDADGTTEVAAFVVLAAGLLAATGHWAHAGGVIAVATLLLVEKSRLHAIAARLDDLSLRAGVRFAVMAVVILPLLPDGPYGPLGGVRPRTLWIFVLLFSGLSFAGYIARRAVGGEQGYPIMGMLGGLISSTNVTVVFSRLSRTEKDLGASLAAGVMGASTVLFLRVLAASAVLNASLARTVLPHFALPFLLGVVVTIAGLRRKRNPVKLSEEPGNPLQFWASMQMALLFQGALFGIYWLRSVWGEPGVLASGALVGLVDVDALTVSAARGFPDTPVEVAGKALSIGILADTALKILLALIIGKGRFRWIATGGLLLIGVGLAASVFLLG